MLAKRNIKMIGKIKTSPIINEIVFVGKLLGIIFGLSAILNYLTV
jgi:hypothetical protein